MTLYKQKAIPKKWKNAAGEYDGPPEHAHKFGRVEMTPEEVAAREAEIAENMVARPLQDWKGEMVALDAKISRREEDLIDWMVANGADVNKLSGALYDAYQLKKTKRAQRPK